MLIDITLKITPKMAEDAHGNEKKSLVGHLGTHFDVMDKEFPLAYCRRKGIVFDVSAVKERNIDVSDIDLEEVEQDMFVAFCSGWSDEKEYGTKAYSQDHPQLSDELIDALLKKRISLIGIDFGGVRRGKEHTPKDQYCADRGVFIVENLCNLKAAIGECIIYTFPMNYQGISGLPCRVIVEK